MKILAIETSCDETSAAIITEDQNAPKILSNIIYSQINTHKEYGGVVPEVAARAHIENIISVIEDALKKAKTKLGEIDFIAATYGPGLVGSLLIGVETAKGISLAKDIPFIPINHLEGHIYAGIGAGTEDKTKNKINFPALALIISGGHTQLVLIDKHLSYQIIGKTRDDAAGEAFDKAAKIMGLEYPGGPAISRAAEGGDEKKYKFPIIDLTTKPYRDENSFLKYPEPSLDFSFSGLKTSLLTKVKELTKNKKKLTRKELSDLSASFQLAITNNVIQNTQRAIKKYSPKTFILSGGVAANKHLRKALEKNIRNIDPKIQQITPESVLCTDNAAMIGVATYYAVKLKKNNKKNYLKVSPEPGLKLGETF